MTETELKLYSLPGIQKLFREKMGAFRSGDWYWCPRSKTIKPVVEDGYFDSMKYDGDHKLGFQEGPEVCCPDVAIRLPLPIDPINEKRGLWGMIDWNKYPFPLQGNSIDVDVFGKVYIGEGMWISLTEALLRAIMQQEGIEE